MLKIKQSKQKRDKKNDPFLAGKDSKEEVYVEWYLQELKEAGIVFDFWPQPEIYTIANPVMRLEKGFAGRGKNKTEIDVVKPFKAGKSYKPDFRVKWINSELTRKFITLYTFTSESNVVLNGKGFLYCNFSMQSDLDVKPNYQPHDAAQAKFSLIQSIVLNQYKIFVQPVVYQDLFEKTFTPKRFLLNDSGDSYRRKKINNKLVPIKDLPETITLDQFLSGWTEPKF